MLHDIILFVVQYMISILEIIGICVVDITSFLASLLRIASIPTAAAVPITLEITAESIAMIRVCLSALSIVVLVKRPVYHLKEKPPKTHTLDDLLKENAIITRIGAYRKNTISATYKRDSIFI